MYYNYNDFELLYLIKDGCHKAEKMLYYKYTFLIKKIYFHFDLSLYSFPDFMQEGYLLLNDTIRNFDSSKASSFYTYFYICLKHTILKLTRRKGLVLKEGEVEFKEEEHSNKSKYDFNKNIIIKDKSINNLEIMLIQKCFIDGVSLSEFCRIYNINYNKGYYLYKKLKVKIEKILTK